MTLSITRANLQMIADSAVQYLIGEHARAEAALATVPPTDRRCAAARERLDVAEGNLRLALEVARRIDDITFEETT